MEKTRAAFVASLIVAFAGCIPLSLHAVYTHEDVVEAPNLVGAWEPVEEDGVVWTFESAGGKEYRLTMTEDGEEAEFSAHVARLGDYLFLDLFPLGTGQADSLYGMQWLPMHSFWKLELKEHAFAVAPVNYEWLEDRIERGRLWVPHEEIEDQFLFTGSTKRMQRFAKKWAKRGGVFDEMMEFERKNDRATPAEAEPPAPDESET